MKRPTFNENYTDEFEIDGVTYGVYTKPIIPPLGEIRYAGKARRVENGKWKHLDDITDTWGRTAREAGEKMKSQMLETIGTARK